MQGMEEKTVRLKSELTLIDIEDSGTLLDVENRCYYDLNDIAFFLVRRMEEGCQYRSLMEEFIAEFDVEQETARSDVANFVDELLRHNLVLTEEGKEESVPMKSQEQVRKPYRAPMLEYKRELTVAAALEAVTIAN